MTVTVNYSLTLVCGYVYIALCVFCLDAQLSTTAHSDLFKVYS